MWSRRLLGGGLPLVCLAGLVIACFGGVLFQDR
jgi:hypothetical protein